MISSGRSSDGSGSSSPRIARLHSAEEPLRPAEGEERRPGRNTRGLDRLAPNLGRDIDGRPAGGLEPIELGVEVRPGSYDLRESGVRARTHSIVSFVMSMVF